MGINETLGVVDDQGIKLDRDDLPERRTRADAPGHDGRAGGPDRRVPSNMVFVFGDPPVSPPSP
jgi:hypothetical protein